MDQMILDIILVAALVLTALATVLTTRLLWSAIFLSVASAVLSIILFQLQSPWAAVFELSVCAGLIPVILISSIGLIPRLSNEALAARRKLRRRRYLLLPLLVAAVAAALVWLHPSVVLPAATGGEEDVRKVLWVARHADLLGQVAVLLGGAFAVAALLKGLKDE